MLDLWSRRVVGWATGETLHARLARRALAMAIQHRRPSKGLWHHSDRGVQSASGEDRSVLKAAGIEASMSRRGNPYDNAAMESFNATYKRKGGTGRRKWWLRHTRGSHERRFRLRRKVLQPGAPP